MCRRSGANVAVSYAQACCSNTCQLILTVDNCMSTQQNRTGSTTSVCNNTTSVQPLFCRLIYSSHFCTPVTLPLSVYSSCHSVLSWCPDDPLLVLLRQLLLIRPPTGITVSRLSNIRYLPDMNMKRILPATGLPPYWRTFCLFLIYPHVYVLLCF